MIKEQESGEKTADVCRRHGNSSATFYKYKSKYGGMEPSDAKRLRALEDENGKLKKLLAEQMFPSRDIAAQCPAGQGTMPCCKTSIQKSGDDVAFVRHWSEDNGRMGEAKSCGAFDGCSSGEPGTVAPQAIWQSQICREGACEVLQADRSSVRYLSRRGDDAELRDAIKRVSRERRRFGGCRRIHVMIAREGFVVNHKKVRRI